jgi:RNA polymerase sigma-70 factor (ECF subfamily)
VDDRKTIERLKQGDITGLEALFREYQLQAICAADFIVRDPALAQDIVQAAFLRAYEHIDQFQDEKPFGPWFLRMVVNAAIQAARRQQRWVSNDNDNSTGSTSIAEQLLTIDTQLEVALEVNDTRQAIWQALRRIELANLVGPAQRRLCFPPISRANCAGKWARRDLRPADLGSRPPGRPDDP